MMCLIRLNRCFWWSLLGSLAVLLICYIATWHIWHGWVNYDTFVQWQQVQSGEYTQWHPFAHTFLMMKLPSLLWNDYRVTVIWQILWFALAFGYLAHALQKVGLSVRWMVACLVLTFIHPQTLFFMMTPLKDSAFAIAGMLTVAALIQVVVGGATTLKQPSVWLPLALGLALTSVFRHNGIFFSLPVLCLLLAFYVRNEWRSVVRIGVVFVVLMCTLKVLLPSMYHVKPASAYPQKYQFIESSGLPLSMMGAVYMKHPDTVPDATRELLESIAPRDIWLSLGDWSFSAVKHHGTAVLRDDRIAGYKFTGWKVFVGAFWETMKFDPKTAIAEGLKITGQVWNPAGHPRQHFWFPLKKLGFSDAHAKQLLPVISFLSIPLVGVVGLSVWACTLLSLYALRKHAYPIWLLTLPILAYNLGTMCFLSGYAVYRFFFVNVLVFLPVLLVTIQCFKKGVKDEKTNI